MEKFIQLVEEANKHLKTADHLTYVTYPLVNDIKLLMSITENLYVSLIAAMESLLYYDRLYKRIPPYSDNFDIKFDIFKTKVSRRYNIKGEYVNLIPEIRSILLMHKESPMEFRRRDNFVICNSKYGMKTLSIEKLKIYIQKTKLFIEEVNKVKDRNESLYNR